MSIDVLQGKIRKLKNPSLLSLEPVPELIPAFILEQAASTAQGYETFCTGLLDGLKDILPGIRVSLPCFLALGGEGLPVMSRLLAYAKELGYYVILDGIPDCWGSVGQTVADAVFGAQSAFPCDGVILNGYCGTDAIKPWLPYLKQDKSVFVLTKSPNRSSVEVQDLLLGGRSVHTAMVDLINRWGGDCHGKYGYDPVGAVVGAPHSEVARGLRSRYSRVFLLLTGIEVGSASPKGCQYAFDRLGYGAAVCAGGYLMGAWQKAESDGSDYVAQALEAAQRLKKNLNKYIIIM